MFKEFDTYQSEAEEKIDSCSSYDDLLQVQSRFVGKDSPLAIAIKSIAKLPPEDKKVHGVKLHRLFGSINKTISVKKEHFKILELNERLAKDPIDVTLPVSKSTGALHPITKIKLRIENIFTAVGFKVATGPEIETEYYNFTALNIPSNHPARDSHDTFYFDADKLLRTHTSPVQVHILEKKQPPLHIVCPGRVYRYDLDATHTPMFHQVEGLVVDKADNVSFAHLKHLLVHFLETFFEKKLQVRFRPSYFPFTEPSVEVDIGCIFCNKQAGCNVCSNSGWIEVLGAGMVHPNVLQGVNIDSNLYQGLAFGIGVERLTMLYYKINDLRLLYENHMQLLTQFENC